MPLAESKIDWALLGRFTNMTRPKSEVLLSSVPNNYVEQRLDMLESVGFNVIAFEPRTHLLLCQGDCFAPDATLPQMVLDIGATASTDLIIVVNGAPRLTRSIPIGQPGHHPLGYQRRPRRRRRPGNPVRL